MGLIVTIDGIDGSGKSTFARRLVEALSPIGSVIIHIDDFRRQVDWRAASSEADVYYDEYFDLAKCQHVLEAFTLGEPSVEIPAYDPVIERVVGTRQLDLAGVEVAIVEGVFPQRVPAAAAGLVIYLDVDHECARSRILERDGKKGRSRDEIEHRIGARYFPCQERYHATFSPRERADVVIANEPAVMAYAVRRDLSRVPEHLRQVFDSFVPRCRPFDTATAS
jgi:uridine kinase